MTAVPPPAPPPLPPLVGAIPTAAVEAVPVGPLTADLIAKLVAARRVTALVEGMAAPNMVKLRTDVGTLTVGLALPVKPGSELALQVVMPPAGGQPRLVVVGSRPPGAPVQPPPLPTAGQPTATAVAAPASPQVSDSIVARMVRPEPHQAAALPPQGTSFAVRVIGMAAAGVGAPITQQPDITALPPLASGAAPTLPGANQAVQVSGPMPASPGSGGQAMPNSGGHPPAPAPAMSTTTPAPLPAQFTGIVQLNSHAGQPVVRTPFGLLALEGGISLPAGTTIRLEVAGPLVPPPPASAPVAPQAPWSGLEAAMQSLRRIDPGAAERLAAALPQPGPRLAAGLMITAAAVQWNAAGGLLPEAVAAGLERAGRRDLIARVSDDLAEATAPMRSAAGEWRTLTLPLLVGVAIEPIRLFMRRPAPSDEEEAQGGKAQGRGGDRFVVDVTLSRFGRLQLDGFLHRPARRFDMILRCERPLPDSARNDITGIFTTCCAGLGLAGAILFHIGDDFVEPDAASGPPVAPAGLVV